MIAGLYFKSSDGVRTGLMRYSLGTVPNASSILAGCCPQKPGKTTHKCTLRVKPNGKRHITDRQGIHSQQAAGVCQSNLLKQRPKAVPEVHLADMLHRVCANIQTPANKGRCNGLGIAVQHVGQYFPSRVPVGA